MIVDSTYMCQYLCLMKRMDGMDWSDGCGVEGQASASEGTLVQ
jgi:hypothetical protein